LRAFVELVPFSMTLVASQVAPFSSFFTIGLWLS
jgi:hypothetical protein